MVTLVKLNGTQCVCKQFKSTKSVNKIKLEAELQRSAPRGRGTGIECERTEKAVVHGVCSIWLCGSLQRHTGCGYPRAASAALNIMSTLDSVGVLHNDGNIQNLRMDYSGKMYLLDYGMSKKITPALTKNWGPSPNHKTTLFMIAFI